MSQPDQEAIGALPRDGLPVELSIELSPEAKDAVERVGDLSRERFAPRADEYDRSASFPEADFDDLFDAGLLAPTAPRESGGLGLGPLCGDAFGLWMMTKEIAKADLSLARCWEGHANSLVLIDALGSPEQQQRWFGGVVQDGEKWVAWSGEPRAPKPGEANSFGTAVTRVDGGWAVSGNKVFATSATGADWAILLVNRAGPGGARHADDAGEGLLMLACRLADSTVSVDDSWWDPIGMRATVSHLVRFDDTFVADADVIGEPGSYLREGWQTAFIPHYGASFLGAAQAAYEYALEYVIHQGKGGDPYVQQRVGAMLINVEAGHLWLDYVASLWDGGHREEAQLCGSRARHVIEHLAEETLHHCIRACGARALVRPSPIERILRDLTFYLRHDNDDHILATIGRAALGETHDPSFYKP
ncbi:MAG: acyl-CoA dehydrogenase [Solirubrobacterales bacterium]|nr:acyl-CoA dehydrogenase [Solirubrobacterales bacterium]